MFTASVGIGKDENAKRAGTDAATQALAGLPGKHADCLLVFGSASLDQDAMLSGIADAAPGVPITGCSSAGEISSEGLASEDSVVVAAFTSDSLRFGTGFGTHMRWNARQCGVDCAQALQSAGEGRLRAALLFGNVLAGGLGDALSGFVSRIGADAHIIAGGAADNYYYFETNQYSDGRAYDDALVGVGVVGEVVFATASRHGFLPVGVLRRITKVNGNVIEEIDGAPATRLYEEYFGEQYSVMLQQGRLAAFAASYPFGIYEEGAQRPYMRLPLHVDVDNGVVACAGEVKVGAGLRLMISDTQQGLSTAREAARELMGELGGKKPKFVLMISSAARRKMLGRSVALEVRAIQEEVGRDVPIAGFCGFAEFVRDAGSDAAFILENGAIALAAIAE